MDNPAAATEPNRPIPLLEQGRAALRQQQWGEAFFSLCAAHQQAPLEPADLEGLAMAAYLLGKEEHSEILARAHQGFLAAGNVQRAARCAFWLGMALFHNGEMAQAGGWLARARRLVDEAPNECVERGYVLIPVGIEALRGGDAAAAHATFVQAAAIGETFRDANLIALARLGQGRALIRLGEITRGISLLDETMVAVTTGEASPMVIGGIYCSVIEACTEIFDLRRAQEWTAALDRWCSARASGFLARRQRPPRVGRSIGSPNCIGSVESLPKPRPPTAKPASGSEPRSPALRCYGWRKVRSKRPRRPFVRWRRKRRIPRAGRTCWTPLSKSCSRRRTCRQRARRPKNSPRSPAECAHRCSMPSRRARWARCGSPNKTLAPRWRACGRPTRFGRSWRRPTRRRGFACCWRWPAGPKETAIWPISNWRPRAPSSSGWARRPNSPASSGWGLPPPRNPKVP